MYLASLHNNYLLVADPKTNQVTEKIGPFAFRPDEKKIWLADGVNNYVHVFDATTNPPKQIADVKLSDSPGWVSLGIDATYVFPSTDDVIDRQTRKIVYTPHDETGAQVQSEKLLEIDFEGPKPVRNGNQFGVGLKR